jgi:hypothetical protein
MLPQVTTTRHGPAPNKPFFWSWSKIKNYEVCPKRHYHIDVAKDIKEEKSEELKHGDTVHLILEQRVGKGTTLPPYHQPTLEPWAQWILNGPGKVITEAELAITKDFQPCAWFDSKNPQGVYAWFRAKIDVLKLNGPVGILVDWKTGKIKDDPAQLMLNAAATFMHYPELVFINSYFVWLAENATSEVNIQRAQLPELWSSLWPRIEAVRIAHEAHDYPPTPNRLCAQWCPVKQCPHNGQRYGG